MKNINRDESKKLVLRRQRNATRFESLGELFNCGYLAPELLASLAFRLKPQTSRAKVVDGHTTAADDPRQAAGAG
jgi:hypothetical protein